MTREEAITTLKEMHDSFDRIHENSDGEIGYEQMTALDMAIEALSANEGLWCALADRKCFAQGYDFTWCITCPHISEEDRQLVNHAVLCLSEDISEDGTLKNGERREP